MKRFHWFEILLAVIILGSQLYAAFSAPHNFSMNWFSRDDAFYYFKVAQNIVTGHGSTFDGINPTNGYHPLWLLVCLPIFLLAQFDLILPLRILTVVMAGLNLASSILLFRLLRKVIGEPVAILAAAFWGLSTLILGVVTQPGLETGITVLAIVVFLYRLQALDEKWRAGSISTRDIVGLALAALFLVFSRLDTIYLVLIAGVWIIFRQTATRYLLPLDLLATFSIIVLAYIQRAELSLYLLAYSTSAITAACVTFAIQTIIFYFVGLYEHPGAGSIAALIRRGLLGGALSALVSGAVLLLISAPGWVQLPHAVPLIYWLGVTAWALVLRIVVRLVSPWPVTSDIGRTTPFDRLRLAWRTWLTEAVAYYGIVGTALAIYLGFNKLFFGTPLPVSGQIKRWWSSLPDGAYGGGARNIPDVFALDPLYSQAWGLVTGPLRAWAIYFQTHYWSFERVYWSTFILVIILGAMLFLHRRRRSLRRLFQTALIPLLISAELQAFFYGATGYASEQEWYWAMQLLAITILLALGAAALFELLPWQRFSAGLAWTLCLATSAYFAFSFISYIYARMPYQDAWAGQPDIPSLTVLEEYTPPGAVIGITGGGDVAYFIKDRKIVNMDGLINSAAYFQALQAGTAGAYLRNAGVGYVFGNYFILTESMPYRSNLDGQLEKIPGVPQYGNKQLMRLVPKH